MDNSWVNLIYNIYKSNAISFILYCGVKRYIVTLFTFFTLVVLKSTCPRETLTESWTNDVQQAVSFDLTLRKDINAAFSWWWKTQLQGAELFLHYYSFAIPYSSHRGQGRLKLCKHKQHIQQCSNSVTSFKLMYTLYCCSKNTFAFKYRFKQWSEISLFQYVLQPIKHGKEQKY